MFTRSSRRTPTVALLSLILLTPLARAHAQPKKPETKKPKIPQIPDQPRTVDPARFVPPKLAAAVTVKFDQASLREVGEWIQKNRKVPVLFDKSALADAKIPLGTPLADHLDNQPLYLLLNRLSSLGLAWYVRKDILHITTKTAAEKRMITVPYNLGDLLDAGYQREPLLSTVRDATAGPWSAQQGAGGELRWLGDVLFVRQSDAGQREVKGLLAALRKHGRQTFTLDPPQHEALRKKLGQNVSVDFDDTPLATSVNQLARKGGIDIRLDVQSLRKEGLHERQPVKLTLSERDLGTVLGVLLADLKLTYVFRDGVLLITTATRAEEQFKAAVYDVRDLCRDSREAEALKAAVKNQTKGPWFDVEGVGGVISFPRAGTMVVRNTERRLNEVGQLLTTYRAALRSSKPRARAKEKSREVVTRYYRMPDVMATDLFLQLPRLVEPDTWKSDANPKGPGTILKIASQPGPLTAGGNALQMAGGGKAGNTVIVPQAVLVIRQRRSVHEEISDVIRRVERGDAPPAELGIGGLGGVGGGGFGGGFFSVR